MKSQMTEEEIVKGCQAGKERCQKMLYDRFSSLVMGISMRYAKNRDDAQDIFQDVFVRVFVSIKHFKFLGSFEGWVRKIAVNSAVSWYRQEVKEKTVDIDMEADIPDVMVDEELPFTEGDLLGLIQELPSGYRMVFNLFAIEGYKHEEIAEMLGCSVGTSRSQYFKAKKSLKKRIVEKYKQVEI